MVVPLDALYTIVSVIVVVGTWSYYFVGVNMAYRIVEATSVGIGLGIIIVGSLVNVYNVGILKIATGNYITLLWFFIGFIGLLRLIPRLRTLSRPAIAYLYGIGMAVLLRGTLYSDILSTIAGYATYSLTDINTSVMFFALGFCLIYFIWNRKLALQNKRTVGIIPKIGRFIIILFYGEQLGSMGYKRFAYISSISQELIEGVRALIIQLITRS